MKAKFDLKTWMTDNRETVIAKFEKLQAEENYNGCTLKSFMTQVFQMMVNNRISSANQAESKLPHMMGFVYVANNRIEANDWKDEAQARKYAGTAYMAIV